MHETPRSFTDRTTDQPTDQPTDRPTDRPSREVSAGLLFNGLMTAATAGRLVADLSWQCQQNKLLDFQAIQWNAMLCNAMQCNGL